MKKLTQYICTGFIAISMTNSVSAIDASNMQIDGGQVADFNQDGANDCAVHLVVDLHAQTADSSDSQGNQDHFGYEVYDGNGMALGTTSDVLNYLTGGVLKTSGQHFGGWHPMGLSGAIFTGNSEPVFPYEFTVLEVVPGQASRPVIDKLVFTKQDFETFRDAHCPNVTVFPKDKTQTNGGGLTSVTGIKGYGKPKTATAIKIPRGIIGRPVLVESPAKLSEPPQTPVKRTMTPQRPMPFKRDRATSRPTDNPPQPLGDSFTLASYGQTPDAQCLIYMPRPAAMAPGLQAKINNCLNTPALAGKPLDGIIVTGHTDTYLPDVQSMTESLQYAQFVGDFLQQSNPGSTVITQAKGETALFKSTGDGIQEQLNRFVDIRVYLDD